MCLRWLMLTLTVRFVVVCLCKLFVTQQDTALWLRDAFKRRAKPRIRRAHYEIWGSLNHPEGYYYVTVVIMWGRGVVTTNVVVANVTFYLFVSSTRSWMTEVSISWWKKSIGWGFGGSCKVGPVGSENGQGMGGRSEPWSTFFQRSSGPVLLSVPLVCPPLDPVVRPRLDPLPRPLLDPLPRPLLDPRPRLDLLPPRLEPLPRGREALPLPEIPISALDSHTGQCIILTNSYCMHVIHTTLWTPSRAQNLNWVQIHIYIYIYSFDGVSSDERLQRIGSYMTIHFWCSPELIHAFKY